MTAGLDLAALNARLADSMGELARALAGEASQHHRDELRFRGKGSLSVMVTGPKRGEWYDHEAGCGGDPVGLVAHLRGVPMREAYGWAVAWLGDASHHLQASRSDCTVASPEAPSAASTPRTLDLAQRVWREGQAPAGTLVERYLASRGLALPDEAPLAFHPSCPRGAERWPAMLALMTDPVTGEAVGVHRTFLARDGSGKAPPGSNGEPAKMMCGNAGVVRMAPDESLDGSLGVAEGIETSLAVMQRGGAGPVWAATSAGAIRRLPVLADVASITVFADADPAGMQAARECCRRWADYGRSARLLAPPTGDWDDALPWRATAS